MSVFNRLKTVGAICILLTILGNAEVIVTRIDREIDLRTNCMEEIQVIEFKVRHDQLDQFTTCSKKITANKEAYFRAGIGMEEDTAVDLTVVDVDSETRKNLSDSVVCKGLKFKNPIQPKEEESHRIHIRSVYTDIMEPLPERIIQLDEQKMTFKGNLYALLPYEVKEEKITILVPSAEVFAKTEVEPFEQSKGKLEYGPYYDIPRLKMQTLSLHFTHDAKFATAVRAVKEIQISLWGNVYVEEFYEIENTGPKVKGEWSRLDYFKISGQGKEYTPIIRDFTAMLPWYADQIYYRDNIGNVSTSALSRAAGNIFVGLKPRYPLFGGWKTTFTFGYSIPLDEAVSYAGRGRHLLRFSFLPSITNLHIRNYEIRAVLPDGSILIAHEAEHNAKGSLDTKHWYFDYVARPVLVLQKSNVVALHDHEVRVIYRPSFMSYFRKPILLCSTIFLVLFGVILLGSFDFRIVASRADLRERSIDTKNKLKQFCKEHIEFLGELQALTAQMKSNHSTNKVAQIYNKIDVQIKEVEEKMTECVQVLKQTQCSQALEAAELVTKAKDCRRNCSQLYEKLSSLLQAKASKKEVEQELRVLENTIAHLTAGVQDALGYLN